MKRKLIRQGGGGYTIYLPKKWIENKKLEKGEYVDIAETEQALIIAAEIKEKKSITIKITNENKQEIQNILTHLYRKGFNKIILEEIDSELLKQVKNITKELLLGFEITSTEAKSVVIENISEPTEEKYDVILRKVFLIIKETQDFIINSLETEKPDMKEMQDLRNQQDKYILFCRRLLTREKYEKNITLAWELLTFLMHIEHAYYYFYKFAVENKIKKDKELIEILKELKNYFSLYYDAYYKKDINFIHKINSLKNKFQFGKCISLIESSKAKNSVLYSYIREIFRLIQVGTSPILADLFETQFST